jgi:hypothetical protein
VESWPPAVAVALHFPQSLRIIPQLLGPELSVMLSRLEAGRNIFIIRVFAPHKSLTAADQFLDLAVNWRRTAGGRRWTARCRDLLPARYRCPTDAFNLLVRSGEKVSDR